MKRRLLKLLDRVGLVGPAFRAWETLQALVPGPRRPEVEGPPLPPRRLMVRVAGTADAEWFLRSGRAGYDAVAAHVPLGEVEAASRATGPASTERSPEATSTRPPSTGAAATSRSGASR
jgi:hypothetical protein